MKNFTKYLVAVFILGSALPAAAQTQEDIFTDPLFSGEQIYYTPIPLNDLEAEKIKALQDKDQEKMYIIGMMYRDGQTVEPDIVQSQEWFKRAAELGHSDAMVELARIYSLDKAFTGLERDQKGAEKWITEAEKLGNPKALYTLGTMYEDGFPFDRSYEESFSYFKKAADKGILNAYVKLYIAYQYGKGTDPDLKKAIYWLRKIEKESPDKKIKDYARQMLSDAYFEIGLKEEDPNLKFKLFNLAWSKGNRYAIEAIGDMFQSGVGVKQSYPSAVVAYETAIKDYESVYAMERLGFIYLKGPAEINMDYKKAFDLFTRAADLGGVTASYELGYMYYYGIGVEKNPQEAAKWFERSKQLASKNSGPRYIKASAVVQGNSGEQLKSIISDTTMKEMERERQKNIQREMEGNEDLPRN